MYILALLPAFLVLLYALYKFIKDDYVLIRRNLSPEQIFDIAFITLWSSLLVSRIVYFLSNPLPNNIFVVFFTPNVGGFSLVGAVIGGLLGLYLIGKYKRVPLGRLFDFFTLSFLISLPVGFLGSAIFLRSYELWLSLIIAGVYLVLTLCFLRFFYPKLLNRTMKEGSVSIFFLIAFSLVSFLSAIIGPKGLNLNISMQSVLPVILFIFSLVLFFKLENSGLRTRKYK